MANDQKSLSERIFGALKEIIQPFIDLIRAPRALWGVNLAYLFEGFVYFGMVMYLAMYFNEYVGLNDVHAGYMLLEMTAGITIMMFFLGSRADKWGVRRALLLAFVLMICGRSLLAAGPYLGLAGGSLTSPLNLVAALGILIIVVGYGMYQPAAYAAVRQFTTPKTAAMGFAMLYALMNLGGFLPSFFSPIRNRVGISGAYWVYVSFTVIALLATFFILSRKTVAAAIARAKRETQKIESEAKQKGSGESDAPGAHVRCPHEDCGALNAPSTEYCSRCGRTMEEPKRAEPAARKTGSEAPAKPFVQGAAEIVTLPPAFWFVTVVLLAGLAVGVHLWLRGSQPIYVSLSGAYVAVGALLIYLALPRAWKNSVRKWLKNHPLANAKFAFFIFCLIPVQTLFAHNWLTLPMYVERAYRESWPWISTNFEPAVNFNPLLIFILVPIVTAVTQKRKVYNMMILGTFIMAAPTFLLAVGAEPWTLVAYLLIMTLGESMWQPRFLQYAAEIAPEGRTGAYMGVAQFPWFLTKVIVPLYSGWFLMNYCPDEGEVHSETMWLVYGLIAISSTVMLILAKPWAGKDFKTKAD